MRVSRRRLKHQIQNTLLFMDGLLMIANAMLGPIFAFFIESNGGSVLDAGLAGSVFALTAGFVTLIAARFTDHTINKSHVIAFGYIMMSLGYVSFMVADSMAGVLIGQVVIGLGQAIYVPAFDGVYSRNLVKNEEASGWGRWESMNYFAIAAGASIGSVIVSRYGFSTLFAVMAILGVIAAYTSYFYVKE